jgi:hypothetical protein
MANQFGGNPGVCISWSNGLTGVLIARIAVAAAELYQNDWEFEFARWIATVDQNRGPLGCVGFDLTDIPWGAENELLSRKKFVVEVVVHAASREVACRLPYYPNPDREEFHRECLREFALMVHHFEPALATSPPSSSWHYLFLPSEVFCRRHRLFCHAGGCMVCPDDTPFPS